MGFWVAAFVGEGARNNLKETKKVGKFFVSSTRTPIKKVQPGDGVLLYLAGEGFVARAEALSGVHTPYGEVCWSGRAPLYGVSLGEVRAFDKPIPYKFPKNGVNPILSLHRYSLTGGFARLSEEGFCDVLRRADLDGSDARDRGAEPPDATSVPSRVAERNEMATGIVPKPLNAPKANRILEKRLAGQHAYHEGRKRAALWTVAEMGASAFGLKGVERFARDKACEAERTWIAGGRAEQNVGAVLDGLCEHGYYLFHDVKLPDFGNVDHVALGPRGFFAIETKSHKGRVRARGDALLLNGRPPDKDFIAQSWSGCYRLKEIVAAEFRPLLCFSEAFVEGRVFVRGVRILPLRWLRDEILRSEPNREAREVGAAVNALGSATGCYPSAVPRISRART